MIKKIAVLIFMIILFAYPAYANEEYTVILKNTYIPQYVTDCLQPIGKSGKVYLTSGETAEKYKEYFESITKNEQVDVYGIPDEGYEVPLTFSVGTTMPGQYDLINVDFMRDITTFGKGVKVAVIDTGCINHPDLKDSLKGGYNYVTNSDDFSDTNGHGTHVTGIIAASLKGATTGIAPQVEVYALKCLDDDKDSYTSMFVSAIREAVDRYDCDIISMSIGMSNYTDIREACKYAYDKGVIIIAAVGNDGNKSDPSKIYYPAGYDEVIGVGSCYNSADGVKRSGFSQKNSTVMVCAPGQSVRSTYKTGGYTYMTGTSQATPMVAAIAALIKSIDPSLTPKKYVDYLSKCSVASNDDYCGYGMIDAEAIFKECIKGTSWYISPITDYGVSVYNNTGDKQGISAFVTGTDGGECTQVGGYPVTLENEGKITLSLDDTKIKKMFLWQTNLKPIIKPVVQ
jgi:subtilisin family serine protease